MSLTSVSLKKFLAIAFAAVLGLFALAGCGSSQSATESGSASSGAEAIELEEIEMARVAAADVEGQIGSPNVLIVDVRKAADYEAGHIEGAISADMDAAVNGDNANGVETMSAALEEATGSENGDGKTIVLVCYSGNRYAQAATNILNYLGAEMDQVFTLQDGMNGWTGEVVTD